jgi:Ca2+-binding EF-hand superfamily protein
MGAKFSTVEFESKQCYSKWSIANVEAAWQRHEALQDPTAPKLTISAMDFRTVFSDFEVIIGGTFLSLPGSEFDLLKSASRQCFTLEVFGLLCVLAEGERKDSMEDRVKMLLHIFDSDRDGTLSESEILLLWGSLISAFQKVGAIETSQTSQDDMRKLAEWLVRSVDLDGDGILSVEELVMWCAKGGGKHIADVVALVLTKDGKDRNKILAKKGKKSGKSSPKNGKSSPDAGAPDGAPGGGAGGGHGHSGGGHGSPRGGASMSGQRVKPAAHVSRMQSSEDDLTQVRAEALAVKIKALERDTGAKPSKEDYLRLNKEVAAEEHHRLEAVFKTSDFGSLDVELDIHDILQIRFGFAHMANKSGVLTRPLLFRVLKHRFPNINACGREAIIRCGPLPSPTPLPYTLTLTLTLTLTTTLTATLTPRCGEIIDADKDGTVDFREFVQALSKMRHGSILERAEILFGLYDMDGDQQMSSVELYALLSETSSDHSNKMALSDSMLQVHLLILLRSFVPSFCRHYCLYPSSSSPRCSLTIGYWCPWHAVIARVMIPLLSSSTEYVMAPLPSSSRCCTAITRHRVTGRGGAGPGRRRQRGHHEGRVRGDPGARETAARELLGAAAAPRAREPDVLRKHPGGGKHVHARGQAVAAAARGGRPEGERLHSGRSHWDELPQLAHGVRRHPRLCGRQRPGAGGDGGGPGGKKRRRRGAEKGGAQKSGRRQRGHGLGAVQRPAGEEVPAACRHHEGAQRTPGGLLQRSASRRRGGRLGGM